MRVSGSLAVDVKQLTSSVWPVAVNVVKAEYRSRLSGVRVDWLSRNSKDNNNNLLFQSVSRLCIVTCGCC